MRASSSAINVRNKSHGMWHAHIPLTLFCSGVPVMSSFEAAWKVLRASYSWLSEFFNRCAYHSNQYQPNDHSSRRQLTSSTAKACHLMSLSSGESRRINSYVVSSTFIFTFLLFPGSA